jgi:hypothetical protein
MYFWSPLIPLSVTVLIINAIAVLSEDRFLARSKSLSLRPMAYPPITAILCTQFLTVE